ncbi:hypothetical protein [Methylobacterium sp. sgz302541]|uniref:hypothetical protein n=1 Tax=unclassified Methylobacterium TaxID=2615210 RepID=UPI003D35326A
MRHLLVASAFAASLLALPALAQTAPEAAPAHPQRNVTATGVTKPPAGPGKPAPKTATEAQMAKAQKAAAARDKAWDVRTRASMGSICKGC